MLVAPRCGGEVRKALIVIGHVPSEQTGMEECARWLKTFVKTRRSNLWPRSNRSGRPRSEARGAESIQIKICASPSRALLHLPQRRLLGHSPDHVTFVIEELKRRLARNR